jgi:hypothetical protein
MHNLTVEFKEISSNASLSKDLAQQIVERSICGKIVVATPTPIYTYASVKKQLHKLIRRLQVERASIVGSTNITRFMSEIARMQHLTFSHNLEDFELEADVTFATAEELVAMPPVCRTLYATYAFEHIKLHQLTSWMPLRSLVVIYEDK